MNLRTIFQSTKFRTQLVDYYNYNYVSYIDTDRNAIKDDQRDDIDYLLNHAALRQMILDFIPKGLYSQYLSAVVKWIIAKDIHPNQTEYVKQIIDMHNTFRQQLLHSDPVQYQNFLYLTDDLTIRNNDKRGKLFQRYMSSKPIEGSGVHCVIPDMLYKLDYDAAQQFGSSCWCITNPAETTQHKRDRFAYYSDMLTKPFFLLIIDGSKYGIFPSSNEFRNSANVPVHISKIHSIFKKYPEIYATLKPYFNSPEYLLPKQDDEIQNFDQFPVWNIISTFDICKDHGLDISYFEKRVMDELWQYAHCDVEPTGPTDFNTINTYVRLYLQRYPNNIKKQYDEFIKYSIKTRIFEIYGIYYLQGYFKEYLAFSRSAIVENALLSLLTQKLSVLSINMIMEFVEWYCGNMNFIWTEFVDAVKLNTDFTNNHYYKKLLAANADRADRVANYGEQCLGFNPYILYTPYIALQLTNTDTYRNTSNDDWGMLTDNLFPNVRILAVAPTLQDSINKLIIGGGV
jgi:hypothetical protein